MKWNKLDEDIKSQVRSRYYGSQINYSQLYTNLYAAYNLWYGKITNSTNDRYALNKLKQQTLIWHEYLDGKVMQDMSIYIERIIECTQLNPLITANSNWGGYIESRYDWRSLIEFWYQVRCLVVHGENINSQYVYLAYMSLNIFIRELVAGNLHKSSGMKGCLYAAG